MKKISELTKTYKRKAKILLGHTYQGHRKDPIIFILSTGRCGSTSIKDIFNQHPKFLAFHEVIKPLIYLSTQLAEQPELQKDIYRELDAIFGTRIWEAKKGQIIVHSDHRLWNLVPYLSNYFPNAYFIHLMRNPYDSVQSYLKRDWYNENVIDSNKNLFQTYRLYGDKVHEIPKFIWDNYTQIDKCLWYWNYVNFTIHTELKKLESKKNGLVRLESFITDINRIIDENYDIGNNFYFKNITVNESKRKLNVSTITKNIHTAIIKNKETLFLDYYPNSISEYDQ